MSGRKNVLPPFPDPALTSFNMAGSVNGTPINVQFLDNIACQLKWSGANPIGTITFQVSLDFNPNFPSQATWDNIQDPPGTDVTVLPGGAPGSKALDFNQLSFPWFRVVYTTAGGSVGSLSAVIGAKQI